MTATEFWPNPAAGKYCFNRFDRATGIGPVVFLGRGLGIRDWGLGNPLGKLPLTRRSSLIPSLQSQSPVPIIGVEELGIYNLHFTELPIPTFHRSRESGEMEIMESGNCDLGEVGFENENRHEELSFHVLKI